MEQNINDIAKTAFEPVLFTPLQRAQKDGYINITGVDGKKKIEYITSEKHVENYEDPEEKVRAEFFAELIYKYEYPANRIKVEVVVPDRLPTDRADIVVFSDNDCKRPYAIVECKKEGVTDAEFNQAIEQGVGNATWVKLRAEYVVIIAGGTRRVLDVSDKYGAFEREQNIIADLPRAYGKPQEFRFYKGTDLDVKGVAFEQFMDGFFKGDFGQYFTPRPIIEFCVKMMKPEQDWDVLDPSCGSGGFLLHALDYMRNQAGDYYEKGTVDYFNYWHDFAAKHLFGIEINDEIARVAKMNMIVHDDGHTNVISHDALESIDKMHDHNRGFAEN